METAIAMARQRDAVEHPVGAVIVKESQIISSAVIKRTATRLITPNDWPSPARKSP